MSEQTILTNKIHDNLPKHTDAEIEPEQSQKMIEMLDDLVSIAFLCGAQYVVEHGEPECLDMSRSFDLRSAILNGYEKMVRVHIAHMITFASSTGYSRGVLDYKNGMLYGQEGKIGDLDVNKE